MTPSETPFDSLSRDRRPASDRSSDPERGRDAVRPDAARPGAGETDRSLARLLAPVRSRLRRSHEGYELVMQPMRPADALVPFTADANGACSTLLIGRSRLDQASEDGSAPSLLDAARAASADVIESFGPDRLVVDDLALGRILTRGDAPVAAAVRIQGPIEASDAEWIERALRADRSPLEAELRASVAMVARSNDTLAVECRDRRAAIAFGAEQFRHYMSAVLGVSANDVARPDVGLVVPLFEDSGAFTVRPIETDVFSTAVDVGVATSTPDAPRPADASLIYDLHANTWHGE